MSDERIDIKPPGVTHAGDGFHQSPVERHRLAFSRAATFQDLAEDYVFFTLALMYARVPLMGRDPWNDYLAQEGRGDTFQSTVECQRPVFQGLEVGRDVAFNHVLWAMQKQDWEPYCAWMGQLAFTDRDQDKVTRLRTQRLTVADPFYLQRVVVLPDDVPTVDVTVFWLDTNLGCVYMQPGSNLVLDPPRLVTTTRTFPDTVAWARAILDNKPDPYATAERVMDVDPLVELAARVKEARENET